MTETRGKHTWRRRLLALALSVLLSFLAAEVLIRVLVGAPLAEHLPIMMMQAHPERGWMMVPGQDHYTYHHLAHINSLGLRGPEVGPKEEGTVRILALGDSLVYGQGVGDDETIPFLLQEMLTAQDPAGRKWEVINSGHRAYDTRQELALLEELGPELQPDVVVLFWFWNDLREHDPRAMYDSLRREGEVAFDTHDRVEGWDRVRWYAIEFARRSALVMFLHDARARMKETPWEERTFTNGLEHLEGYLERFKTVTGELGSRMVFAAIPDANILVGEHQSGPATKSALELAMRAGLDTIDLREGVAALVREGGRLPVIPYDGHYLPEANRAMAEALVAHLLR